MSLKGYLRIFCKKSVATHILALILVIPAFNAHSQMELGYLPHADYKQPVSLMRILDEEPKDRGPRKATLLSTFLPGAGQFYNKKYWKMPIIYAGMGALIYSIDYYQGEASLYEKAYNYSIDNDTNTKASTLRNGFANLSAQAFKQERDQMRNNRDFSILLLVGVYALQIIDANVDAHLKEFDVGDDLSMRIQPKFNYNPFTNSFNNGVSLSVNIKQKSSYKRKVTCNAWW